MKQKTVERIIFIDKRIKDLEKHLDKVCLEGKYFSLFLMGEISYASPHIILNQISIFLQDKVLMLVKITIEEEITKLKKELSEL